MLIKYTIGNYLSFKEKQVFDLSAEPLKELPSHLHTPHFYNSNERILKSAAFHGHNSHGKSNFFKSFKFFIDFITKSFDLNKTSELIDVESFLLNTNSTTQPSFFEVVFLIQNTKYRYGFEITKEKIVSEWLFYAEYQVRENYLFIRNGQEFQLSKTWNKESQNRIENQGIPFTKPRVLLLSVLLSLDDMPRIPALLGWLNSNIFLPTFGDNLNELVKNAVGIYTNTEYKNRILFFLDKADLGFKTIFDKIDETIVSHKDYDKGFLNLWYNKQIKYFELYTQHAIYDDELIQKDIQVFELLKKESDGSVKFFILSCLIAYSIKNSNIIWADELDARLHPSLFELMIKLFHEPAINSNGTQLIFTTHNTVLLNKKLRRDQIFLIEKDDYGKSSLKRLHSKESPVRIDTSIEKEYRKGALGGVSKKITSLNNQGSLFEF